MPLSIYALTGALATIAVGLAAAAPSPGLSGPDWIVVPLAATLVAAGVLQVEFRWRGERYSIDLFEAALVPLLVVFAGPGGIALTAAAKLVSQRLLRVAWLKTLFNTAQWAMGAAIASIVYLELRGSNPLDIFALALAVAAAVLNSHTTVATAMAMSQRGTFMDALRALVPSLMPGSLAALALNTSLGLLFGAVVIEEPALTVLFLVPLGLCWWGQKAYTEVVVDRSRVQALQDATHHMVASPRVDAVLPEALEAVRLAFASVTVAIVDRDGNTVAFAGDPNALAAARRLALTAGASAARVRTTDSSSTAEALRELGHRNALIAPVTQNNIVRGALVSIDRSGLDGFDAGEVAVFEALASAIASAQARTDLHEQLVGERAHLFEIIDRSSDGIFTVTADGVIGDWNPAMVTITGFRVDEAAGGTPAALLRPSAPGGSAIALERWKGAGESAFPAEIEILTRTGEARTLQCSYSETASEPTSLVVTARDVTKQRELDRLRDDFVATVSHELRTPLTSIIGFSSMLLDPPRPLSQDERNDAVAMIRKGARRLERLIYNLLEVSRIEDRATAAPGPIDLEAAVENAIGELQETYPHREIRVDLGSRVVRAIGNQLSVEQILTNLLGNALKYSEHGPVEVTIDETPDQLTISVRDHGPGIPASEQEKIFDRFHRMDQHHVQAGTGLGLYISRRLAAAMGGELSLESAPGEGSTFLLHLPGEVHLVAVG